MREMVWKSCITLELFHAYGAVHQGCQGLCSIIVVKMRQHDKDANLVLRNARGIGEFGL